jgi:hypothetical protein
MYNLWGKSVLAKMADKEGIFVEWVKEIREQETDPGVYYLYLDSVDEQTRDIKVLVKKFKTLEGSLKTPAQGSFIYFREGIDTQSVALSDPNVTFKVYPGSILLQSYPEHPLTINIGPGMDLIPQDDYWVVRDNTMDLLTTAGGRQTVTLPSSWLGFTLYDKDQGFRLRPGIDFRQNGHEIEFNNYTPPGRVISAVFQYKADPQNPVHPENNITAAIDPKDTLIPDQTVVRTSNAIMHHSDLLMSSQGFWLKKLLLPGFTCNWTLRVEEPDYSVTCSKMATNEGIIPGLRIAIGDKTYVGDEVAVIVTKDITQTYEVYGSTENISFTINVTANDRDTVNDLAGMLKEALLVKSRDRHEMLGLTIYEASMSTTTEPRDSSGVQSTTTKEISISAASNWRFFAPIVNRVASVDISVNTSCDFLGRQLQFIPFAEAFGIWVWKGKTFTSNGLS